MCERWVGGEQAVDVRQQVARQAQPPQPPQRNKGRLMKGFNLVVPQVQSFKFWG